MKNAGRLLALLLAVALLAALFGCSLSPKSKNRDPVTPETTAEPTSPARADDLSAVNALFADLFRTLTRAQTSVSYNDPAVGTTLSAFSTLTKDGDHLTYRATVDRVNSADEDRFLTSETLPPVTGTVEEIRENCSDLIVWDRVATGLVLSTPAFTEGNLASPVIRRDKGEKTLAAFVPDEKLEAFFGLALSGVSGMQISVTYSDGAVRALSLSYTAGEATVKVSVAYTY